MAGLPVTAAAAKLAARTGPAHLDDQRAAAMLSLEVFDRLTAGETAADVAAAVSGRVAALRAACPPPAWSIPDGDPVDRRIDQLQPGDMIAGLWERGYGGGRHLVRTVCGPVAAVSERRDRREAGDWHTVTLTTGDQLEYQSHVWFAVHPHP